jgi:polyphosphate kinase 2
MGKKEKEKSKANGSTGANGKAAGKVALENGKGLTNGTGRANGKEQAFKPAHPGEIPTMRIGKDCDYEKDLHEHLKVVVLFEGRDAAGKGGAIKRITESLNPRICKVVALGTPTEREKTQWYFQRYVPHLPGAGEMVLFDRSWYNRAGVERVMSFCTDAQYQEFLLTCPEYERMLVRSGIVLIKYWFSVSDAEQERRFQDRMNRPTKRWKISPMDLESRKHWADYSRAKDEMFNHTDHKQAPWFVVNAEDKKAARLNVIRHLLSKIPYKDLTPEPLELPPIVKAEYVRPPYQEQHFIPVVYR